MSILEKLRSLVTTQGTRLANCLLAHEDELEELLAIAAQCGTLGNVPAAAVAGGRFLVVMADLRRDLQNPAHEASFSDLFALKDKVEAAGYHFGTFVRAVELGSASLTILEMLGSSNTAANDPAGATGAAAENAGSQETTTAAKAASTDPGAANSAASPPAGGAT